MDDIVRLGESSQFPSTQGPIDLDSEYGVDIVHGQTSSIGPHVASAGISNAGGFVRVCKVVLQSFAVGSKSYP